MKNNPGLIYSKDDNRDYKDSLDGTLNWNKGFDIEKELGFKIPFKNQFNTGSCTGQAVAYYIGVLWAIYNNRYDEVSARSIYSQIFQDVEGGGSSVRDAMRLAVNWGSLHEAVVPSYDNFITQDLNGPRRVNIPTDEKFIRDINWKNNVIDNLAGLLKTKEYRIVSDANWKIDLFAEAIEKYNGIVVEIDVNLKNWNTYEPIPGKKDYGHALYFGKFGIDKKGKYVLTPNSWGNRRSNDLHPDGWQKLREDYFKSRMIRKVWVLKNKSKVMTLAKILKDKNGKIYIAEEQTNPSALYAKMLNVGIEPPEVNNKPNTIDFDKLEINGDINWK